jgi:predicted transcriptional regulator
MNVTENYGLKKPAETDFYNVEDFNENMDKIDEELQEINKRVDASNEHTENKGNPHEVTAA